MGCAILLIKEIVVRKSNNQIVSRIKPSPLIAKLSGFNIGYKMGLEIGIINEYCLNHISSSSDLSTNDTTIKTCNRILTLIMSLPTQNDPNVDFDVSLDVIRTLFRSIRSKIGGTLPSIDISIDW